MYSKAADNETKILTAEYNTKSVLMLLTVSRVDPAVIQTNIVPLGYYSSSAWLSCLICPTHAAVIVLLFRQHIWNKRIIYASNRDLTTATKTKIDCTRLLTLLFLKVFL